MEATAAPPAEDLSIPSFSTMMFDASRVSDTAPASIMSSEFAVVQRSSDAASSWKRMRCLGRIARAPMNGHSKLLVPFLELNNGLRTVQPKLPPMVDGTPTSAPESGTLLIDPGVEGFHDA
jgi:hypothetical protein